MPPTLEQAQEAYKGILAWAASQPELIALATRRKLAREDVFFLLWFYLNRVDVIHPWVYQRCREFQNDKDGCLDVWSRFHFKALALDTQVRTTTGWKRHIDLAAGDFVFSPDGEPVRVIANTGEMRESRCFAVNFTRGQTIIAAGDHRWPVIKKSSPRKGKGRTVKYSESVVDTFSLKVGDRIARTPLLDLPDADLPIDPYLLGCWLGDGETAGGRITCADPIWSTFGNVSHAHDKKGLTRTIYGLRVKLRELGVLGNKHVPESYLNASAEQRRALLQGLMDTDGTCAKHGQAVFCNTNPRLAEAVAFLSRSLGVPAHATHYYGYSWQVSMQPRQADKFFRLERKLKRCASGGYQHQHRKVRLVEEIESVPVNCIQVEGGLYLAGEQMVPTHNSTIITFAGTIQDILTDPECTFCIFSNTSPLARQFLRQIKTEFEDNGKLKVDFHDILWSDPEKMSPKWSEHEGIIVKRRGNPKEATIEAFGLIDNQPTSKHFSHRVYDDVVTQESVGSVETIKKTTERWELSIATGQGGGRNIERYVGTFYHGNDTYQEIMRRGVVKVRRYPATEDGRADGIPVLMPQEELMKLGRSMGPATFSMQMLLDVKGGSVKSFRQEWLKYWPVKREGLNVYIIVDPSSGKMRKRGAQIQNDYTSMLVFGVDGNGNRLVIDLIRDRLNLNGRTEALFRLHRKYRPVQQVGYEESGMQADIEHIEYVQKEQNYRFQITPLSATLHKSDVIESSLPQFAAGQWYLPEGGIQVVNAEGRAEDVVQTFITEEYNLYPVAKHDDTLNTFGMANHKDIRIVLPGNDFTKIAARRERAAKRRRRSLMAQ